MYMYRDFMLEMDLFTCSFTVVKYGVGVLNYPGYSIRFIPAASLVL